MCREALIPYLTRKVGLTENEARDLLVHDEALEGIAEERGAGEALALARRLVEAVRELRAIDPAVGSGAFPLGLMSELVRLRRLAHLTIEGAEPTLARVREWRLEMIERSLFGVDVNPTAIELCRLRLWLSLLTEESATHPHQLPNLDYRTIAADSLRDFVGGVEVQQTRTGAWTLGHDLEDPGELVVLRERYFEASEPAEKQRLRRELEGVEDELVERIFARVDENARRFAVAAARSSRQRRRSSTCRSCAPGSPPGTESSRHSFRPSALPTWSRRAGGTS